MATLIYGKEVADLMHFHTSTPRWRIFKARSCERIRVSPTQAISDGVFAVIITILVFELKPPSSPSFEALASLWPALVSYAVRPISQDNWNMDNHFLERPNAKRVQLDFFYDYRTNVELYAKWQAFLREHQPKTIIFWGQGDIFFTPAGGEAYLKDLPKAEMHRLQSGHFAVEDHLTMISREKKMRQGR